MIHAVVLEMGSNFVTCHHVAGPLIEFEKRNNSAADLGTLIFPARRAHVQKCQKPTNYMYGRAREESDLEKSILLLFTEHILDDTDN